MARLSDDGAHSLLPGERPAIRLRPISISAIPRPVSGTSRQVSSRLATSLVHQPPSHADPERIISSRIAESSAHARHKPTLSNDGMPPTSFSMPRAMLPRSDSQLRYRDRPSGDLSGVKEQFHIRKYSSQKLHASLPPPGLSDTVSAAHPSSKGVNSTSRVASAKRDITSRTLMRPIQASLPRSQTLANLGCLPNMHDISPSKPVRKSDVGGCRVITSEPGLDIMDALLESRMTRHEIESLDQVRADTIKNQKRLSPYDSLLSHRPQQSASSTASDARSLRNTSAVTHLSTRPTRDSEPSSSEEWKVATKKPLYVNTMLANTVGTYGLSPMSHATSGSGSTYPTLSSSAVSSDPRNVYRAEESAYWTGRYVATTDRVRRSDCDLLLRSKTDGQVSYINSDAFEQKFDQVEATRAIRVLEELRQFCKTPTALKSFNHFEAQFRTSISRANSGFVRSQSDILKRDEEIQAARFEQNKVLGLKQYSGNVATSPLSVFSTSAAMQKISGFIGKQGKLIKSNTTGNLESAAVLYRPYTPVVPQMSTPIEGKESSHTDPTIKRRTRVMEQRMTRPFFASTNTLSLPDNGIPTLSAISEVQNKIVDSSTVKQYRDRQSTPKLTRAVITENTTTSSPRSSDQHITATEVNFSRSVPKALEVPSTAVYSLSGQLMSNVSRTRARRSSGQRSGEFVKKVVGAGIREVRKVSRRVGSMGWPSSSDGVLGVNE